MTTTTSTSTGTPIDAGAVAASRRRRSIRYRVITLALAVGVLTAFTVSLMLGQTFYTPIEVARVILGDTVPGASFTVGELRLPRAVLGVMAGFSLGMAGVTFQTMLRNPLASPDIIGISWGASAAGVFAIVILGVSQVQVSAIAICAALATAMLIYVLAYKDGVLGTRLILIGIGIAAMLESVVAYVIVQASQWDLQAAMRWLTGSLNGAVWEQVLPTAIATVLLAPLLLSRSRDLQMLQMGDDAAAALGVRVETSRLVVILIAVTLIAFATAAAGPIAFVAFLSGPIAARIIGPYGSLLLPSALVGALLVLCADLVGQYGFGTRYPVGVITGAVGAPYLIYLLVRVHRSGGSL
ncbi:FecCD family ABC transporter permease [Lolliginicoccus suaedae]|uniref:FecCD family ABC transporter permease n=1 Tax=Lolliginicoccus suaedae TaxID=2605429 RepID=UPI0011EE7748|nr:iron chelate uptake ABC transporter family permease subunit [Lolliginicoccus suaedae]